MKLPRRRHPARRIDDVLLLQVWHQGDSMMTLGARGSLEASTGYLVCATVLETLALRRQLDRADPTGVFGALTPREFERWHRDATRLAEDIDHAAREKAEAAADG